ncbi:MAG: LysO family transporter [Desulfovibrionaceae bacterium]|nr:LysO family transporter [Desulfovibrionaceae bacterium]
MFTVFFIMLGGMVLGFLLRGTALPRYLDKAVSLAILLLLFTLGGSIGSNEALMRHLPTLGGRALLLTLAGMGGSILLSLPLSRYFFKK